MKFSIKDFFSKCDQIVFYELKLDINPAGIYLFKVKNKNVSSLVKVDNKDTRTKSLTSLFCQCC